MKKQRVILVFAFLLALALIQCAGAVIDISGPSREVFNLGDRIDVSGYILETENTWGVLRLDLYCTEKMPLLLRSVSIRADEKFNFKETIPVPYFAEGRCKIIVSLLAGANVTEQTETKEFLITKELIGSFEASKTMVQLGDEITIKGKISRQDGTPAEGFLILYFKLNSENVLIDSLSTEKGEFNYIFNSESKPAGVYDVVISANDVFGNEKTFTDISQIKLVNEIYVFAKPSRESILPEQTITIFGEAKTVLQQKVEKADAVITLDNEVYRTKVSAGEFSERIALGKSIKSGQHNVRVVVDDGKGNLGQAETSFTVQAVPTKIEAEISGSAFKPKEAVKIVPKLYDQAGDFIQDTINVALLDDSKKEISSGITQTNKEIEFLIPEFAEPGNWHVVTKAFGLEAEGIIAVGEIEGVDFFMDNETLVAKNTGNVKYKKTIEILAESAERSYKISRKISLKPSEEMRIELAKEVETGVYTIKVNGKEFTNVMITGRKGFFTITMLYYAIALLIALAVIYFIFSMKKKQGIPKMKMQQGSARGKFVNEKTIMKAETAEEAKKRYANEFRQMALKKIEERDKEVRKGLNFSFLNKKKEKGPEVLRLGDRELYRKKDERKINNIVWGRSSDSSGSHLSSGSNREIKKPSREERKKFLNEARKDGSGGGLFDLFR